MNLETIKARTLANEFFLSDHADQEAADENIELAEIRQAMVNGEILEHYADTGSWRKLSYGRPGE